MKEIGIPDEDLVSSVLAGDGAAYAALVDRYTGVVSSIAFLMVRDEEDARDIVQEAFIIAYCNLARIDAPRNFGAWVRGIVLNCCRKTLDRRTRTQRFLDRYSHSVDACDPVLEVVSRENARRALCALDTLSEPHREIAMLYYLQDMSVDDIARLIERPAGTVKRCLAEARGKLRKELVDMAREEFCEYQLTEDQKRRLEMIPVFPQEEPKVVTSCLDIAAEQIIAQAPYGVFPPLRVGAEAYYADYDYPGRRLQMISHVIVEGPFDVAGRQALRYDDLSFSGDGKAEWVWRPYYCVEDSTVLCCAAQCGGCSGDMPLITSGQPGWNGPSPQPESLQIVPGSTREPTGDQSGYVVDSYLWDIRVGRRSFQCLRRVSGGDKQVLGWSDTPITVCATEEFFLPDGRLLLWRRYNGTLWSERNPERSNGALGTYERLADAGVPVLEIFGDCYYLWYDQIPSYAIRL